MGDGGDQEAGKAVDGEDQQAGKADDGGNQQAGKANDGGDQQADKMGNDRMGDGVGLGEIAKYIKVGNNSVGDNTGNQDNWLVTVEDMEDSDNQVTVVVNPATVDTTDSVLANVLVHSFSLLLP